MLNSFTYFASRYPSYAIPIGYPPNTASLQPQLMAPPQLFMAPNGSIRSVQSVPMLAAPTPTPGAPTWDGEPCPVHHAAVPLAALYGIGHQHAAVSMGPSSVPPSVISGATTVRRARSVAELSTGGGAMPVLVPPGMYRINC